jgi:hypothetical protein
MTAQRCACGEEIKDPKRNICEDCVEDLVRQRQQFYIDRAHRDEIRRTKLRKEGKRAY